MKVRICKYITFGILFLMVVFLPPIRWSVGIISAWLVISMFQLIRHGIVAIVLAVSLLMVPTVKAAEPPPEKNDEMLTEACCVMAVGAVVCWGIWKLCQRIPAIEQPIAPVFPTNSIPTNTIPTNSIPTNSIPKGKKMTMLNVGDAYNVAGIGSYHLQDPYAPGTNYYKTTLTFYLEASEDMATWRTMLSATGFLSDYGMFVNFYTNGNFAMANYTPWSARTNWVPIDVTEGRESRFYRVRK